MSIERIPVYRHNPAYTTPQLLSTTTLAVRVSAPDGSSGEASVSAPTSSRAGVILVGGLCLTLLAVAIWGDETARRVAQPA